jgi:branched-chain amino acid aminotransferase
MSECFHIKYILNGEIADCSSFDIDLVFRGESIYEVVRIIEKIPLFWEDHVARLYRTSEITGMSIWHNEAFLYKTVCELIRINSVEEGNIKLVFNFSRRDNLMERNFLAYFVEPVYPSKKQCDQGVKGILFQASRINPTAKVINQNLRLAVYKQLIEKGAYEALLIDREGKITEGSRSNIFLIRDGNLFTAPDSDVLAGIARNYVIETCLKEKIPLTFKKIDCMELGSMDAVFMTGTSPKVLPFSRIEKYSFDTNDPVLRKIMDGYQKVIGNYISKKKV